jgi:hypothetical protein
MYSKSNNTSEQINIPHDLELHSSSAQIFDTHPIAMLETVVIHVDDEFAFEPKKPKKVVTNVNHKFQEIWIVKMPWAKPIFNEVGVVSIMKCHVSTILKGRKKIWLRSWILLKNMQVKERV